MYIKREEEKEGGKKKKKKEKRKWKYDNGKKRCKYRHQRTNPAPPTKTARGKEAGKEHRNKNPLFI